MLRAIRDERGASTVIVAAVVVLLFCFTALAVDVARMYEERRELQRTADVVALSGAQRLSESEAVARNTAQGYVLDNTTTYHTGGYTGEPDPVNCDPPDDPLSDCVDATYEKCDVPGFDISFDCVEARIVARPESMDPDGFSYLFVPVIPGLSSWRDRPISAEAKAVLGAGAPGGDKLVPWLVRDCPRYDLANDPAYPQYAGEDDQAVRAFAETDPNTSYGCPYQFSTDYTNGPFVNLFLGTGAQGNYQGGDLATYSPTDCPPVNGYFNEDTTGASGYEAFLGGQRTPCPIFAGARLHAKTGQMTGPTDHGLDARNVDSCINDAAEYDAAIDPVVGGAPGEVHINHWNQCMVAVAIVVHTKRECPGEHPNLRVKTAPGDIAAMQREILPIERNNCSVGQLKDGRFGAFENGTSRVMIVRRIALFYIVNRVSNNAEDYRGLFLKAIDSNDAELGPGKCTPESGICVVKLIG